MASTGVTWTTFPAGKNNFFALKICADSNLLSRRRSKQPEQLQINPGKEATPNSRRGSVGSVGSADLPGGSQLDIVVIDSWILNNSLCVIYVRV